MDYRRPSIRIPIVIKVCPNVPNISGDVLVAPNFVCVILATVISMDFLVSMSS
jgi:hypothetical protein